ncbi:hypothetical protein CPLU01_12569 [Colletotrichum plurivorum]|uniref:Uncharacterized protein n=1 Tax=Colletotrichum plurivorum TaxID=2175906 RepID=A0A8H6JXA1_9PEZI|nr:hypothetical protein CPLU01_12569 [Colletotrichum plurivorum]
MPPKKTTEAATGSDEIAYTASDIKLMAAIIETIPRPVLDYEALAEKLGSSSVHGARMRISTAVGKYPTWFGGNADAGGKPKAKRTPKKAPSDDDEAIEQDTTSKKKARTAKPKTKPKAASQQEDDQAEDAGVESAKQNSDGQI